MIPDDVWIVFSTQGEMTYEEVVKECGKAGWAPVLSWKEGDKVIIPCFTSQEMAVKFCKRNIAKGILWGSISPIIEDLRWMQEQGWELRLFTYPNRVADRVELDVVILTFHTTPDIFGVRGVVKGA